MLGSIGRRAFLQSGAVAALTGAAEPTAGAASGQGAVAVVHEPARDVPVVREADVVVCGSGPAGVAAAVTAARSGAHTVLLEVNGCLGGTWTSGLLSWLLDTGGKTGFIVEVMKSLDARGGLCTYGSSRGYDVERMKLLLDDLCAGAGLDTLLHTRVVAAMKEAGRVTHVITESKSGRQAWAAPVFVDATGDGDVAAFAGCGFDVGRAGSGEVQPMSFICLLTGLEPDGVAPFVRGLTDLNPKEALFKEMNRAGVSPSYAHPTLFCIRPDLYCLMANHEYGVSATDARPITEATIRGRHEVFTLVEALRALGSPWANVQIIATPEHIGVREGRRVHGRYTVTEEDLVNGARHEDAVCLVKFGVDVHSPDPNKTKAISKENIRAKPYDVPYRSLLPVDIDGLLVAGRCISGDFIAHSSYRVTGNAAAMGQAAGAAAAVAAKSGRFPHEVPWPEVREALGSVYTT